LINDVVPTIAAPAEETIVYVLVVLLMRTDAGCTSPPVTVTVKLGPIAVSSKRTFSVGENVAAPCQFAAVVFQAPLRFPFQIRVGVEKINRIALLLPVP
jgi:hypothetical protein